MEMNDRAEKAVAYKHKDCNCAQAVLLAFADELGRPEEELRALGSGFGMGMGCTEATCGALCGASMVMGLCNKSGKPTAAIMREILHEFQEKAGATICKDLKGIVQQNSASDEISCCGRLTMGSSVWYTDTTNE